jgi:2-polyprenyl-6-hydroxyphenyl methylase / 3-demethylubiquinone-9 3-methyltransferase
MQINLNNKQYSASNNTIDAEEIAKFSALADRWWDEKGAFRPLHEITPLRIGYIRDHACEHFLRDPASPASLKGLNILDIGCGGGLASEPLCRLGANVTGVDASEKNIAVATLHAQEQGLDIRYHAASAEHLVTAGQQYDVVLALEIIEHVSDVPAFLEALSALTRPGGMLFITTLNRTFKSLMMAKIGAEYVLRWLPVGTHDWNRFLRPSEISLPLQHRGFKQLNLCGMVYHPLQRQWSLNKIDVSVNYLLCFLKRDSI